MKSYWGYLLPHGVMGNTPVFGAGISGSSPDEAAQALIAQLAEAADLKSAKCEFESRWEHGEYIVITQYIHMTLWRSWSAHRPVTAEVAGSSPVRVAW